MKKNYSFVSKAFAGCNKYFGRIPISIILLLLFTKFFAYNNGDYMSVANGAWTSTATWQVYDSATSSFVPASSFPGQSGTNSYAVYIAANTLVTITNNQTYSFGDLHVYGELDLNNSANLNPMVVSFSTTNNLNVYMYGPCSTPSGGIIKWVGNHLQLQLPANSNVNLINNLTGCSTNACPAGGLVGAGGQGGACDATQQLIIGSAIYSDCNGGGSNVDTTFCTANTGGGSFQANPTANPSTICEGSSVTIIEGFKGATRANKIDYTLSLLSSSPAFSFTTVTNSQISANTTNPVLITGLPAGTYTFKLNANDGIISDDQTIVITVNKKSTDPTSASASAATICSGGSSILTLNGGGGGTGAAVKWYSASCGGTLVGTGNNLSVTPTTTTTYYGRYEDSSPCNSVTACQSVTVNVNALPTAAVNANTPSCTATGTIVSFTISGTPNASVNYKLNSGSTQAVILDSVGNYTVIAPSSLSQQTLDLISVSSATCSANLSGSTATATSVGSTTYTASGWSNGAPNINTGAIIDADYTITSGNSFSACSFQINNGKKITVSSNAALQVENGIVNNGTVQVKDNGNFLQNNDNALNVGSGIFTVERTLNITAARKEYNYLISPVIGQNMKTVYSNIPFALYYNEPNDYFLSSSGAYIAGRGLAVKEPTTSYVGATITANFTGNPFNGVLNYPLSYTNSQHGYNMTGNPYSSNLDLDLLYSNNSTAIDATFLFWDNTTNNIYTQQGASYSGQSYAVYNAASHTGNPAGYLLSPSQVLGTKTPNKIAKVAQGFIVRAIAPSKNLSFKNAYRTTSVTGTSFFGKISNSGKSGNTVYDRFWISLQTPSNLVYTSAVVYLSDGSDGFGKEDTTNNGGSDSFYTMLNTGEKLSINGKSDFREDDVVDLGAKLFANGNYVISINQKEGVFDAGQSIYLKDKLLNTVTDLTKNSYSFSANAGEYSGRFEVVYMPSSALGVANASNNGLYVYRDSDEFVVKSQVSRISELQIYNAAGNLVRQYFPKTNEAKISANVLTTGWYVIKIKLQNGDMVMKKIIR